MSGTAPFSYDAFFLFFFFPRAAPLSVSYILVEDPLIKSHMISCYNNFNNRPSSSVPLIQSQNMTDNKVGVGMSSGERGGALPLSFCRDAGLGETERKTEGPELSSKLLSPSLQSVCSTLKAPSIIHG